MVKKPEHLASANACAFQERSVVAAYRYRPPYPAETFAILADLVRGEPRTILDAGCGTGNIARRLVGHAERVDAVDLSLSMIEEGKQLPEGDHPRLRWLHGRVEDVVLKPPYALITAGESIHWMDWQIVLPRFRALLRPGSFLAIIEQNISPSPWELLGEIVSRYRADGGYQPFDMVKAREQHCLLRLVGERKTAPIPFTQTIDECIESYHSRSGFSRERLGPTRAEAFTREAGAYLQQRSPDGMVSFQVSGVIQWGIPGTC